MLVLQQFVFVHQGLQGTVRLEFFNGFVEGIQQFFVSLGYGNALACRHRFRGDQSDLEIVFFRQGDGRVCNDV